MNPKRIFCPPPPIPKPFLRPCVGTGGAGGGAISLQYCVNQKIQEYIYKNISVNKTICTALSPPPIQNVLTTLIQHRTSCSSKRLCFRAFLESGLTMKRINILIYLSSFKLNFISTAKFTHKAACEYTPTDNSEYHNTEDEENV